MMGRYSECVGGLTFHAFLPLTGESTIALQKTAWFFGGMLDERVTLYGLDKQCREASNLSRIMVERILDRVHCKDRCLL